MNIESNLGTLEFISVRGRKSNISPNKFTGERTVIWNDNEELTKIFWDTGLIIHKVWVDGALTKTEHKGFVV